MSEQNQNTSAQGGNSGPPSHPYADMEKECKVRAMVFTLFNACPITFDENCMRYLVQGTEVCPTTGRHHYQGYIYWKNPRSWRATCKKWKCWVRPAKGTPNECRNYCVKEGNFAEFGKIPEQGERTDLEEKFRQIKTGELTADEVLWENPELYHQYGRTIEKLEDLYLRRQFRTEMTECDWIVGPTGVGKSHTAFKDFDPETHYVYRHNDKSWWEGYKQQEYVIINDFRGQIPYDELLQMLDKWAYYVPRRGREPMPFTSKKVIITSPLRPEEAYNKRNEKDSIEQLLRRVNIVDMSARST